MRSARVAMIWTALAAAVFVPLGAAAASPLLEWRDPIYIAAGFAGIVALCLLLVQSMLIGGYVPGVAVHTGRRAHRWVGGLLVVSVLVHVGGLWITSPPDVVDALLFSSPTPFSAWGVVAMWAAFAAALLASFRGRLGLRPRTWRLAHASLAVVTVAGTVAHALLIEGTMETLSKAALCALVLAAIAKVLADLWLFRKRGAARGVAWPDR